MSNEKHKTVEELKEAMRVQGVAIRIMDPRFDRGARMAAMRQADPDLLSDPGILEALGRAAEDADPLVRERAEELLRKAKGQAG